MKCLQNFQNLSKVYRKPSGILWNNFRKIYGNWLSFYESGELKRKGNYKDGQEDGIWEHYYKNGQLKFKLNYKDGIEVGWITSH